MTYKVRQAAFALVVATMFASGCAADSVEIGDSGVTVAELEEAVEIAEARGDDGRATTSRDDVWIRANICEVTDGTVLPGARRRVWVRVENSQLNPVELTVAINFNDGGRIEGSGEVEAAVGDEPAATVLAWNEEVESDAARNGETCTDEVSSLELLMITEAP